MTTPRKTRSTEALWRALAYRCMPFLFEQPGESLDVDEAPATLVLAGVAQPAVKVLGRRHVTLQSVSITGTWSIRASLDPDGVFTQVATVTAAGFKTLDPGCYGWLKASGGSGGTIRLAAAS